MRIFDLKVTTAMMTIIPDGTGDQHTLDHCPQRDIGPAINPSFSRQHSGHQPTTTPSSSGLGIDDGGYGIISTDNNSRDESSENIILDFLQQLQYR